MEQKIDERLQKVSEEWFDSVKYKSDLSTTPVNAFKAGYHQAEKDLELGWEDVSSLRELLDEVGNEFKKGQHEDKDYIGYCKEVLKRFKSKKRK